MRKCVLALLVSASAMVVNGLFAQSKIVAHRGYWKCEGSAQNSINSLERAAAIGAWGSEFDVHLTADNQLVLYHDNSLNGQDVWNLTAAQMMEHKLGNGESLPNIDMFLERAKELENITLIFELKEQPSPQRNRVAAAKSIEAVKRHGLTARTEYITFNLDAAKEFIRLDPTAKVAYLNGELSPSELKQMGFSGLDYGYDVLDNNPQWIDQAKALGLTVNVWTVNDHAKIVAFMNAGVDYITTDIPKQALEINATR